MFNVLGFHGTAERFDSEGDSNEKLKTNSLATGAKMAPAERLRPIGASAEEEVCESEGKRSTDAKQQDSGLERPVHIIIKTQEDVVKERNDSQELSRSLPPIM